jgi:hypothetical protein
MVVALVALFVALSGTSYAAMKLPRNSVGTAQLKNRAVTGKKVRADSLTGKQIKESSLGKVRAAELADRASAANEATALSRVHYAVSSGDVASASPAQPTTVGAACPSGTFVIGGGAQVNPDAAAFVNDSNPAARTGWEATAYRVSAGQSATLTVTAICAPVTATAP